MRPIEFRAWDKKAKVMIYPVVVYETQDHVGFSEETFRRCYDQNGWYEHLEVGDDWYYLFDDKIMQYTGLQDANGQKIFEGDLIEDLYKQKFIVEFFEGQYCGKAKWGSMWPLTTILDLDRVSGSKGFVIGNIYQNKELLNEVKNDSAN